MEPPLLTDSPSSRVRIEPEPLERPAVGVPRPVGQLLARRLRRLRTRANWNLLRELASANFRLADHNSWLGALWGLVNPIAMLGVLYFVFRSHFGRDVPAYPLYLLVGVVVVGFFLSVTRYLTSIFHVQRGFLIDSTVPRETLIVANLFPQVYKFGVELVLCGAFAVAYGALSWREAFLLAPLALAYVAFVVGVGLVLALVHCFTPDVEHVWTMLSRLLFFVTPVFYTLESLTALPRAVVYWGNPLTPFVLAFRDVFLHAGPAATLVYLHSLVLGGLVFLIGYVAFLRFESAAIERA